MRHRERLEQAFDRHVSRLLEPGQWRMETIAGHLWLYLPRHVDEGGDVTAGLTASLLVGAERLERESVDRLAAYVGGVGAYLAYVAERMVVCRLPGAPQHLLDDPDLETPEEVEAVIHARWATGPERFQRPTEAVLAELPTGADASPEGIDVDWAARDDEIPGFPAEYRTLVEAWGTRRVDRLRLLAPDEAFETAEALERSGALDRAEIWIEPGDFLPAAELGDWHVGWMFVGEGEPDHWTLRALHPETGEAVMLGNSLAEVLLGQMSGVRGEAQLPLVQPRFLPAGWPDPAWPSRWDAPDTLAWYRRALQGLDAEIEAAADHLARSAPKEVLETLIEGVSLEADAPSLPALCRRGNGLLELGRHQAVYIEATKRLVGGSIDRFGEPDLPIDGLDYLDGLDVDASLIPDDDETLESAEPRPAEGPVEASAIPLPERQTSFAGPLQLLGMDKGQFWVWRPESPFLAGFEETAPSFVNRLSPKALEEASRSGQRYGEPFDFWGAMDSFGMVRDTARTPMRLELEDRDDEEGAPVAFAEGARSYVVDDAADPARLHRVDIELGWIEATLELSGAWHRVPPHMDLLDGTGVLVDDFGRLFVVELGDEAMELAWRTELSEHVADIDRPIRLREEHIDVVCRSEGASTTVVTWSRERREPISETHLEGAPREVGWMEGGALLTTELRDDPRMHVLRGLAGTEAEEVSLHVGLDAALAVGASGRRGAVVEPRVLHLLELAPPGDATPPLVRCTRLPLAERAVCDEEGRPHCGGVAFGRERLGAVLGRHFWVIDPQFDAWDEPPCDLDLAVEWLPYPSDRAPEEPASVYFAGERVVMLDHPELGRLRIEPERPEDYEKGEPIHIDALEVSGGGSPTVERWHREGEAPEGASAETETGSEIWEASALPEPRRLDGAAASEPTPLPEDERRASFLESFASTREVEIPPLFRALVEAHDADANFAELLWELSLQPCDVFDPVLLQRRNRSLWMVDPCLYAITEPVPIDGLGHYGYPAADAEVHPFPVVRCDPEHDRLEWAGSTFEEGFADHLHGLSDHHPDEVRRVLERLDLPPSFPERADDPPDWFRIVYDPERRPLPEPEELPDPEATDDLVERERALMARYVRPPWSDERPDLARQLWGVYGALGWDWHERVMARIVAAVG